MSPNVLPGVGSSGAFYSNSARGSMLSGACPCTYIYIYVYMYKYVSPLEILSFLVRTQGFSQTTDLTRLATPCKVQPSSS